MMGAMRLPRWLQSGWILGVVVSASAQAADRVRPPTPNLPFHSGDRFEDVTDRAGIHFVHQFLHTRIANILLSNGAGAAVLDYDRDGWMDIYVLNWGPLAGVTAPGTEDAIREPNRLYRNRGDGTFVDVTARAGVEGRGFGSAAAAGDFDNDGWTDLFVVNVGKPILFRNRGDGTFEDATDRAGVGQPGTGISATFLDYDRDGWLDLFVARYLTYVPAVESEQNPGAYPGPLAYAGEANALYRNRGDGTFVEVTREAGLHCPGHRAMSVSAFDADQDGDTDLYVCNDDTPNALWLNDGKGHFRDAAAESGVAFNSIGEAPGSMNAAIADADLDGRPDLFVTRLGYGSLYLRRARGWYDDRMFASGLGELTRRAVGWGGVFLDMDNDGDPDLVVGTGSAFVLEGTAPLLLINDGRARFSDGAEAGGAVFSQAINVRGAAVLDFDNDGRLDVLLTALADRVCLLRNRSSGPNHWLKLRLEGSRSNRSGLGALVSAQVAGRVLRAEALCPTGFLCQGDPRIHLGLGAATKVERLEIRWPSGQVQTLEGVAADRILDVREP